MRVVIYVRVSTDMQAEEGYSLDAQIASCKAYALSQSWEVVSVYVEEGESAKDLNRTELKRLLADAGNNTFDVLLVYRLDRLTRSVRDLHNLMDMFERFGIKFRSATEVYDTTTAMGRLFITIVAALAEWERGNLSERVKMAMDQLVEEGKFPGGIVPYGYTWDGEFMHLVPEEFAILRELRRLYMSGLGGRTIAKQLNLTNRLRRGKPWSGEMVIYVLENPFYAGKIRRGGKDERGKYLHRKRIDRVNTKVRDHQYPTVFTWEEFEEHNAILIKREKYGNSNKADYWFSGVLRCSRCGSKMKAAFYQNRRKDKTKYDPVTFYRCYSSAKGYGCNLPMLRQSVAEELIIAHVRSMGESLDLSADEVAAAFAIEEEKNDVSEQELEQLQKDLNALGERRKKWQYMFAEDLITENDFRSRKREEDEKERIMLGEMDRVKASQIGATSEVRKYLLDFESMWRKSDDAGKKELMQIIYEYIEVECDVPDGMDKKGKKKTDNLPFRIVEVNFN